MTCRVIGLSIVLAGSAAPAAGQRPGLAHLSVRPVPYALTESTTAFEVFGPPDHLTLDVTLRNEESGRTLVVRPGFFEAIRWRLEAVNPNPATGLNREPVSLSAQIGDDSTCGPAPVVTCTRVSDVLTQPEGWVTARIVLRPDAGALEAGEYRLVIDRAMARPKLGEADGSPWSGLFFDGGSFPAVIRSFTGLLRARADTALAQRDQVRVSVRPVKSFFLDHATGYGVYAPVRELEVEVQVVNDGSVRTITVEPGFLRTIRWSLRSLTDGEREPLDAGQITDVACRGGARQLQCVAGRQVSLPPGGVLIATFELKTRGVAVGTGKYQLDVDLRSAKSMLREGETVSTVNLLDHGSVPIDVHGIEQIEDEKRAHRIEGGRAFPKRDFALALRHFQQINAIDPGDTSGLAGAGDALAGLGRLGEAAQLFERVLPTVGPDSSVPVRLAAIYIALDREEKALDLLNARYPRATVVEMLPHLRRQASTLTKRK